MTLEGQMKLPQLIGALKIHKFQSELTQAMLKFGIRSSKKWSECSLGIPKESELFLSKTLFGFFELIFNIIKEYKHTHKWLKRHYNPTKRS